MTPPTKGKAALAVAEEPKAETESAKRQRIVNKALITLRERHRDEFDQIAEAACQAEGITYKRRLTPQEAAKKKILALALEAGLQIEVYEDSEGDPEDDGFVGDPA